MPPTASDLTRDGFGPARVKAAIPMLEQVPDATAAAIRTEYKLILRDTFENALGLYLSASDENRRSYLRAIADAPSDAKKAFAARLVQKGLEAEVPGVNSRDLSSFRR